MNKKITVIGSLNYDVILKIPRLPFKGETLTANGAAFSAGGKGANQAVQAAKLKTPTYMVGCVGTDASADFLVNTAKEYGVNVDYIRKVPGSSGMGVINAVEDGSVYACIVRGANFEVTKEDVDNAMPILKESGVCILQNEIPVEIIAYAIDKAKEAGCIVVLNAAPAIELPEECLSKVDILVVNEVEAEFYCHEKIDSVEKAKTEIKKMAEKYNITDYRGSVYVFEDNAFTGKVIPMWDSVSKNKAIDELVEKHNLDLEKSYAYGDTNGDINMLRRVGNPIAINPTKELLLHINQDDTLSKTTKIIVERKDTIYSLAPDVEIYKNDL